MYYGCTKTIPVLRKDIAKIKGKEAAEFRNHEVAIARAIVNELNEPRLLLADDPTGNLDEENSRLVMELPTKLNAKGMTIIMVTHSPKWRPIQRVGYR